MHDDIMELKMTKICLLYFLVRTFFVLKSFRTYSVFHLHMHIFPLHHGESKKDCLSSCRNKSTHANSWAGFEPATKLSYRKLPDFT